MARPNKPTAFLLIDRLDRTNPCSAAVTGAGYSAGHALLLTAKVSKKRWKGIIANNNGNLWRVDLVFIGAERGTTGLPTTGTEDVSVTVINPSAQASNPLDIVGVIIP